MQVSSQVLERREQVLTLLSKGYSQREVADELHVHESIISRDLKALEEQTQNFVTELARKTFGLKFYQSYSGINQVIKQSWIQFDKTKNPRFLSLLLNAYARQIELITNGPLVHEVQALGEEYKTLKQRIIESNAGSL